MKPVQRKPFSFDLGSLLLFSALSVGASGAALAAGSAAPAATGQPQAGISFGPGPSVGPAQPAPRMASSSVQQAFERADANRDGRLSREEANTLPATGNRFDQFDTNRDGVLSPSEFEQAAKS